jgi:hypothetical protein
VTHSRLSTNPADPLPPRAASPAGDFVTALAYSFIALSCASLLMSLIQYLLFTHLLPKDALRELFIDAVQLNLIPALIVAIIENMHVLSIALFISAGATLLLSVALLKRREWARVLFAWFLIVTALVHFGAALLPFIFVQEAAQPIPEELRGAVETVRTVLTVSCVGMGLVFGACFAWAAKRLFDTDVKNEFIAAR